MINISPFQKDEIVWYSHHSVKTAVLQIIDVFNPYYKHKDGFGESYFTYTYNTLCNFHSSRIGLYSYVTEVDLEKFNITHLLQLHKDTVDVINKINKIYNV